MASGYLLDTGVANRAAAGDTGTLRRIEAAAVFFVPEIVLGELYSGAYWFAHVHNSTKYLDRYDEFRRRYHRALLPCDADTAQFYGTMYAELRSKGQLIQTNDLWIAALAREHGLTLATIDGDFSRVQDFDFERW